MMVTMITDPVLDALLSAAATTTGATLGVLLRHEQDVLRAVATAGEQAHPLHGATTPVGAGVAGYVLASGQPLALAVAAGDPRLQEGVTAMLSHTPHSVLCVPCSGGDDVLGVLLLLDREGGQFTYDDVEMATLLAGIAGVALAAGGPGAGQVPGPAELGGELDRLSRTDPSRYATVATLLGALLGRG